MTAAKLVSGMFVLAMAAWSPAASSSEVDRLVALLVAKGLVTEEEARAVLDTLEESRVDARKNAAAPAPPLTEAVPDDVRWSGDLRLRYQSEERTASPLFGGNERRQRARYRWRVAAEAPVNDTWSVGFGLASGGSDPRSTNQTFSGGFPTYDARLDYAFAKFSWGDELVVVAGKFKNPIWTAGDLLWDSDIRPEGIVGTYSWGAESGLELFATSGVLVLSEEANDVDDAVMWQAQVGLRWQPSDSLRFTIAPAIYLNDDLTGTQGLDVPSMRTNSFTPEGLLAFDFDAAALSSAVVWSSPAGLDVELFGELVRAFDPPDDDVGWLLGATIGHERLERLGQWQIEYAYRRLERDAWPDFLPDSDFLEGATHVEGSELELRLALGRSTSLVIDYYLDNDLVGTDLEQDLLQIDLNFAW